MKILFVSRHYDPHIGGFGTQTRLVADELARRHTVEMAAVSAAKNSADGGRLMPVRLLRSTFAERMKALPLGIGHWPRSGFSYTYLRGLKCLPRLRALMQDVDIVHCLTTGYHGWAAEAAARAEKVPFVITPYVHGKKRMHSATAALCRRADIVFGLLPTDCENLIDLGVAATRVRQSGVIPLLPETTDPQAFRRRHGLGDSQFVLFVGRMKAFKGVIALLDAASEIWRTVPDAHIVFAGPGDKTIAEEFSRRNDPRLHYLGMVSEQEKGDAMAACDLFCMPSTAEILPAVYLEAWSYGKAVVGGTALGLRELIEGNGAGLIAEQNPASIARVVVDLMVDESRRHRMGARGRALVDKWYSASALARVYEESYENLCGARSVTV